MAFVEWKDQMSVKVQEIDKQHQALVKLINGLFDALKEGKGNTIFEKLISDLGKYVDIHFSTEEKYFEKYGYPEKTAHILEHKKFLEKVSVFKKEFDAGKTGLSTQVLEFLRGWLLDHISGTDKKYSKFFNEKGLN